MAIWIHSLKKNPLVSNLVLSLKRVVAFLVELFDMTKVHSPTIRENLKIQ